MEWGEQHHTQSLSSLLLVLVSVWILELVCLLFPKGSWAHQVRMSVTFRSTAAWTVTWKYLRRRYDSDTWHPQRQIHSVSQTNWCRIWQKPFAWYWFGLSQCFLCIFMSGCYPFYQKDPFILEECPHVYFSGSSPTFDSKLIKGQCVIWTCTS